MWWLWWNKLYVFWESVSNIASLFCSCEFDRWVLKNYSACYHINIKQNIIWTILTLLMMHSGWHLLQGLHSVMIQFSGHQGVTSLSGSQSWMETLIFNSHNIRYSDLPPFVSGVIQSVLCNSAFSCDNHLNCGSLGHFLPP